jgi:hypothetical protein
MMKGGRSRSIANRGDQHWPTNRTFPIMSM